ncbi:MAG: hypothetical protein RL011_451 [Pseudomonadota bacterium]
MASWGGSKVIGLGGRELMSAHVVYIDVAGRKPLPDVAVLRVAANNAQVTCVSDAHAAAAVINADQPISILVINYPDPGILRLARRRYPAVHTILVTEETMEQYSVALEGAEGELVDHLVANRSPAEWTINELRVTVQKLLRNDLFGIAKYLSPATTVHELTVHGSADREPYNSQVMTYAEDYRLGQYMSKLVFGITEELMMNAIYDAPIAGGKLHYAERPRTAPVELEASEFATLSYGCDGMIFAIGMADPFGALTREKLFQYLKKVLRRTDSSNLIDTKKSGAGLGLFKILYSSHALVCNIKPKVCTEVIALIDLQHQVRDFSKMPRSVHYFEASAAS